VPIGVNDPDAMLRYTKECLNRELWFAADPSQQLALLDGDAIRTLVAGVGFLFTNEYEHTWLLQKTGWTESDVLFRIGSWIITLGVTLVLESTGTAEYELERADLLTRIAATYGQKSAAGLGPPLAGAGRYGDGRHSTRMVW
jgi:hypothetical protein